jgi:hypothetical protein
VDGRVLDQVVVVEREHERPFERGQVVDEGWEHHAGEAGRAGQVGERGGAELGLNGPQGGDRLLEQLDRVVVGGVEREPGERTLIGGAPGGPIPRSFRVGSEPNAGRTSLHLRFVTP